MVFFFALGFVPGLHADEWLPLDPADLKASSEPGAPGADAVILYREETINNFMNSRSVYWRVKILTEKGKEDWSSVEIPYERINRARMDDIKARTIHSDGTILPFDGHTFDKMVVRNEDYEERVRAFLLPQVEVGSIVEYKYDIFLDRAWFESAWQVQERMFQRKGVFHYYPEKTRPTDFRGGFSFRYNPGKLSPMDFPGGIKSVSFMPKEYPEPQIRHLENERVAFDLTVENVPALQVEDFMVPPSQLAYRVRFFYFTGSDDKKVKESFWMDRGMLWSKRVDKFIGHDDRLAAAAAKMVEQNDSPEQKARKIYAYVQQLENMHYERRPTRQENQRNELPETAIEVLDQKRGTARELTRLYVALAREVGLEAYVMRVSTRDQYLFQEEVFDESQFDTEIAIANLGSSEVYLDPGTRFCPFGMLEWYKTSVVGMRQTKSGKVQFAETPMPSYKNNLASRLAEMTISDDGTMNGKITIAFHGEQAIRRRQMTLRMDEQQRNSTLERQVRRGLPQGSKVRLESLQNQEDLEKPLIARFDASIPHFATVTGKRLLIPSALFRNREKQLFPHATRVQAVYFEYPFFQIDDVVLNLPANVAVEDAPKNQLEQQDFGAYEMKVSIGQHVMKFHRELAMVNFLIPATSYPQVQSFYEKVKDDDQLQAVLQFVDTAAAGQEAR